MSRFSHQILQPAMAVSLGVVEIIFIEMVIFQKIFCILTIFLS